jgi:hypothetical protein
MVAVVAILPVAAPPIAHAQSSDQPALPAQPAYYPPQPAGPPAGFRHHDGFYLRLATGLSVLHASWNEGTNAWSIAGTGIALVMSFGGALTPNLVLYGEITGSMARNPTQKLNGVSTTLTDYDVSLAGIGPGVAYYLVPANLYFSGTLAFLRLTKGYHGPSPGSEGTGGNGAILTDTGIGAAFVVGKEWWVSTNWGLGVAGIVHVASMKLTDSDARATAEALSLVFSATYN